MATMISEMRRGPKPQLRGWAEDVATLVTTGTQSATSIWSTFTGQAAQAQQAQYQVELARLEAQRVEAEARGRSKLVLYGVGGVGLIVLAATLLRR